MLSPASRLALVLLLVPAAIETDPVRKGVVRALIEAPPGQSVPRELAVRVRPSLELVGQENLAWEKVVSCPVRSGEWTCEIPAGRVDLRVTGASVRPVYRWGVVVQAGQTVDLGRLRLSRGATISGFVQPEGKIPQYSVQVDLRPLRVGGSMSGLASKPLRTMTLESTSRPWGFFRFEGIPPGQYAVLVRDLNLPVLVAGPIVVAGDGSVELPKPLVLKHLSLHLRIEPPRDPYGQLWHVRLFNKVLPGVPSSPPEGIVDVFGELTFQHLVPGDYVVSVFSRRLRQEVSLGGKEIRLDATSSVEVRMPFTKIYGQVLYREQPLPSSIHLAGDSSGFSFQTDERGVFEGYVRAEESWIVRVSSRDPGIVIHLQDPVRMPKGVSSWRMAIRVPDTVLSAEVVDPQGKSISPATIQVLDERFNFFPQNGPMSPPWPRDIIGLRPGPQRLRATHRDPFRQGEPVEVQLREGERHRSVLRLVLPDVVDIRGRVLPRVGSAVGVRVYAWAAAPSVQTGGIGTMTDEDGDFRLILPGGTRRVNLVVLPPGNSLRLLQSEVSEKRRLEIPVRRAGGTLLIEGPDALVEVPEPKDSEPPRISTAILLRKWADLQATPQSPGRLVVPNVEPGAYTLCSGDPFNLRRGPLKDGETGCVSGILKAAGELTLRIP
jgi:hypothetical protein